MIQFTVVYNFKKRLRQDGTAGICIRAYQDAKRKYFTTGILV